MKVGYWAIKGRAFPIRSILHYAGIEFEDVKYTPEAAADWFGRDKEGMKSAATKPLALPSIPYIVDGDMHIFQSMAVLKYAGRKAGLCAKDEAGKQIEDISQGVLTDVLDGLAKARFSEDVDGETKKWCEKTMVTFATFEGFLKGKKFLTGDTASWIDFMLWHMFHFYWVGRSNWVEILSLKISSPKTLVCPKVASPKIC